MTSSAGAFGYTYIGAVSGNWPASLVRSVQLPNGAYITNTFDTSARLQDTFLRDSSGTLLNRHSYAYNLANLRTRQTRTDTAYVDYTYDKIGQLRTAKASEDAGPRLQEQFGYAYDAAGNLNYRTNNALVQTFGVNSLNQLTTVARTGTLTVAGTTTTNASSVTVNGWPASLYKDSTFALGGFSLPNVATNFTAIGQDALGRKDTNSISVNLPPSVSYQYDLNGNLTSDGTRGFEYDDENQLIRVTVTNSWKSEFQYDGKMRRRKRLECTWNGVTWVTNTIVHYVYDGNLVIQERDTNSLPLVTYTRGKDLSGTFEGVGGIGGLLARTDNPSLQAQPAVAHVYYHADGIGNVTALLNGNQAVVGRYLYDPFGGILNQSGPIAEANLYRFSSKEFHPASGLVYYLYRYYEPNLQRWLNGDPIQERAGCNLYRFNLNSPTMFIDPLGLAQICIDQNCAGVDLSGFTYVAEEEPHPPGTREPPKLMRSLPPPGQCVRADGVYEPGRATKVTNCGGGRISCPNGRPEFKYCPCLPNEILGDGAVVRPGVNWPPPARIRWPAPHLPPYRDQPPGPISPPLNPYPEPPPPTTTLPGIP
ncbi:MAG TPA: RHS repeat-associated core domain-containing protein [Clostridia bacterium]|nr:RHS repeat-associated core domain-containing protein [Clostridia bacterium]